jgi:sorbitol-6-phosphate 2-dehydrogenase
MKDEVFFAPLLRGAIIEGTGCPWTVSFSPEERGGEAGEFVVNIEGAGPGSAPASGPGAEQGAAAQIAGAFAASGWFKNGKVPPRIRLRCGGSGGGGSSSRDFLYLTGPDYPGVEEVLRDRRKEAWDIEAPGDGFAKAGDYGASRAGVVKNRTALVTGGAQGFGEEIARGLVSAGAQVFIADLNRAGAEKLAAALNGEQGKTVAFPVEVNVGDEDSVQKMAETLALRAGGLDICVSNAGVLRAAGSLEQDIPSFRFVTEINYTAFAIVTKYCALLMRAQNIAAPSWTSDIIQINSKSGLEGSNKNGSYAGSKFGSIGLVQSFAKELVEYRIKVNAVCPGNFFDGPLWSDNEKGLFVQYLKAGKVPGAKTVKDVKDFYEAKVPMGRGCSGPDVIRAVLYLVEQVYETGQALPVTGGQVMLN